MSEVEKLAQKARTYAAIANGGTVQVIIEGTPDYMRDLARDLDAQRSYRMAVARLNRVTRALRAERAKLARRETSLAFGLWKAAVLALFVSAVGEQTISVLMGSP